jgi:membrane-bound inhibitor of C-type lysozyme
MVRFRRPVVVVAGLAALTACSPDASAPAAPAPTSPAPLTPVSYVCESRANVAVEYPSSTTARLTYQGRAHVLQAMPAASGARYVGTELEWWTAVRNGQETGVLRRVPANAESQGVVLERCSRPAPDVAPVKPQPAPTTPGAALPVSPPCKGGQLSLAAAGGDAGMGHRTAIIGVQNTGATTCSLTGYPTVVVQDRQNRDLTAIRSNQALGSYLRSGQTPAPVELAPGGRAFFDVAWVVIPSEDRGETRCPDVTRLRVTAPGDTTPVTLSQALTPCGGKIDVTPFRAEAEPAPAPAPEPTA